MAKDDLTSIMTEYPYMPLRDVVFHTLRRAIMQGDLKPGERLMEIKLANRLGVSRTPIREAIRMLELEGLVTMVPRKGAQVAEITEKDLKDVLEVRIGLEELAVKFVCQRIDDRQLRELQEASRKFAEAVQSEDLTKLAEADVNFHDLIYKATGNQGAGHHDYNIHQAVKEPGRGGRRPVYGVPPVRPGPAHGVFAVCEHPAYLDPPDCGIYRTVPAGHDRY